MVEASIAILF